MTLGTYRKSEYAIHPFLTPCLVAAMVKSTKKFSVLCQIAHQLAALLILRLRCIGKD